MTSRADKKPEDIYMSAPDAAKEFGYTADHVARLARQGKIVAYREGRRWWVNRDSLKLFTLQKGAEEKRRKQIMSEENKREHIKKAYVTENPLTKADIELLLVGPRLQAFWVATTICSLLLLTAAVGFNVGMPLLNSYRQSAAVDAHDLPRTATSTEKSKTHR